MPLIVSSDKGIDVVVRSSFSSELELQKFIDENPDCFKGFHDEDDPLLVIKREYQVPSGAIDALAISRLGDVYIIETKLYRNQDKRYVVAQVLDYGAAMWWKYSDQGSIFDAFSEDERIEVISKISDFFSLDEIQLDQLISNIDDNVSSSNIRFMILMDELPEDLKNMIYFLNANSRFEIHGVSLEYYEINEMRIIKPTIFGNDVKKEFASGTTRSRKWDESSFFGEISLKLKDSDAALLTELYKYVSGSADTINWGRGKDIGSFNPIFTKISDRTLLSVYTDGSISVNFGHLGYNESVLKLRDLIEEFGVWEVPEINSAKYPWVYVEKLEGKMDGFIRIIESIISSES